MATLATVSDERTRIEEALNPLRLPKGVRLARFEQITDCTGDPAYRFFFTIPKDYSLKDKDIKALNGVNDQVFELLLPLDLGRWPFVEFLESR